MIFVLVAVGIFFWAVKSDQFDDLEKQSVSILFEDDKADSDTAGAKSSAASEKINIEKDNNKSASSSTSNN